MIDRGIVILGLTMKHSKLAISAAVAIGAVLGAGAAIAADLPIKASPPVVSGWTGFYIGGGLGTRSSVIDSSITAATIGTPPIPANGVNNANCTTFYGQAGCANGASLDSTAFHGTIYGGHNWQLSPAWVVGVEADVGFANKTRSLNGSPFPGIIMDGTASFQLGNTAGSSFAAKTNWDSSVRLRAGYLFNPSVLLYATGGAEWINLSQTSNCGTERFGTGPWTCGPLQWQNTTLGPASITQSNTRLGYTAGGGLEAKLAPQWIVRGEYRYADFGTINNVVTRTATPATASLTPVSVSYSTRVQTHTTTIGLSYLFGAY
jgi:outer membrane immunogenic protein